MTIKVNQMTFSKKRKAMKINNIDIIKQIYGYSTLYAYNVEYYYQQ